MVGGGAGVGPRSECASAAAPACLRGIGRARSAGAEEEAGYVQDRQGLKPILFSVLFRHD
jgi:hypothetical protein